MFRFFRAEMYRLSKDKSYRNLIIFLSACAILALFSFKYIMQEAEYIGLSNIIFIVIGTLVSAPFVILGVSLPAYFDRDNENITLAIGTGISRYQISAVSLITTFILSLICMLIVYTIFIVLSLIFLPIKFEIEALIILFKAILYGAPLFTAYIVWIYILAIFFKNKNTFSIAFSIYQLTIPNIWGVLLYHFENLRNIIINSLSYQLIKFRNFYEIIDSNIYHPLRISIVGAVWVIVGIIIIAIVNRNREYDKAK